MTVPLITRVKSTPPTHVPMCLPTTSVFCSAGFLGTQVPLGLCFPGPLPDRLHYPPRHRWAGKAAGGEVRVLEGVEGVCRVYPGLRAWNPAVRLGQGGEKEIMSKCFFVLSGRTGCFDPGCRHFAVRIRNTPIAVSCVPFFLFWDA